MDNIVIGDQKAPPGPSLKELLKSAIGIRKDPLSYLVSLSNQYGEAVRLPVGRKGIYFFNHPEAFRRILQENPRNYDKQTMQWKALEQITGGGLLSENGDGWLAHRRLASPAFHKSQDPRLMSAIDQAIIRLKQRWDKFASSGEVAHLEREMLRLSLDVVSSFLFSAELSSQADTIVSAVITTLDTIVYRTSTPYALPEFVPTRRNRNFRKALSQLDSVIYGLIDARKRQVDPGEDLLGLLVRGQREGKAGLSDAEIRSQLLTMIIAGHETVAMAMSWAFYLLTRHPLAEQQVLAELNSGQQGYLQAVFHEALRLYPPAWLMTRHSIQKDEVAGYTVPAGVMVVLSPYALHRSSRFWEEPDQFKPERFLSGKPEKLAYIPFGAGPRMCIGSHAAEVEAQKVLSALLPEYCLEFPDREIELEANVTLRPKGGLPVRIKKR